MIFFYISLSTYICFNIVKYRKSLYALQQNKYNIKEFGKWIFNNNKQTFLTPELLAIVLLVIISNFDIKVTGIAVVIFYTLMFLIEYKKKVKLKINKKLIFRIIIILLIFIGLNIWFILDSLKPLSDNVKLYYIILIFISYLSYFVVWLANLIAHPFDRIKNKHRR